MNSQSTRDLLFHTRGTKDGVIVAYNLLLKTPMNQMENELKNTIGEIEDFEISLSRQLEKTSNPPPSLL